MKKKEDGYFTDGQAANLFYLTDVHGAYYNMIRLAGQPWITKCQHNRDAVIYTINQLVDAKEVLKKHNIKVYESSVLKKKLKKHEKIQTND